ESNVLVRNQSGLVIRSDDVDAGGGGLSQGDNVLACNQRNLDASSDLQLHVFAEMNKWDHAPPTIGDGSMFPCVSDCCVSPSVTVDLARAQRYEGAGSPDCTPPPLPGR